MNLEAILIQLLTLLLLALPVASIAWTVTHEEVFREPRNYCVKKSKVSHNIFKRKFFYLFTCEYCFSHYVSLLVLFLADFKLLVANWPGYILSFFALVWVANIYMSIFANIRFHLKNEKLDAQFKEQDLEN